MSKKKKNIKEIEENVELEEVEDEEVEELEEELDEEVEEEIEQFEDVKKKSIVKRIFDIIFWVVIICLFFVWIVDFFQVKNNKEPKFCIKEETHKFKDGNVKECIGLGYKVYNYNRKSINIKTEFGPFFIKMKK